MRFFYFLAIVVFSATLTAQTQIGDNIIPTDPQNEEGFGFRTKLSADGNTVAASAPIHEADIGVAAGRLVIFENNADVWEQKGSDILGNFFVSGLGLALDMTPDGNTVVGGAPLFPPAPPTPRRGQVRVFDFDGSDWVQRGQDIEGLAAGDRLGGSVSISADGNTLITGATQHDGGGINQTGETKVYQWLEDISSWELLGAPIYGGEDDLLGISTEISQDGTRYATGAQFGDVGGSQNGYVKVFDFDGTAWVQVGNTMEGDVADGEFGFRLDFNEDATILAISARLANGNNGLVKVYKYFESTNSWGQLGSTLDGSEAEEFGAAVDISDDGEVLAVGAPQNADNGSLDGRVVVYQFEGGDWVEIGTQIVNEADGVDVRTGVSVALDADGDRLSVGSGFFPSSAGVNSGMVQVFDISAVLNIDEFALENQITLYPNPVKDSIYIYSGLNNEISEITLYDVSGKLLFKNSDGQSSINMAGYSSGFYVVSVLIYGKTYSTKVFKE